MLIAIVNGPDGEQVSEIDDQSIVLGRHGTLRLTDRKVSKQHARLQSDGRDWYLEDMGSKNGTFVNGVRVVRPCRVKEGDRLRLGQTQLVLSKLSQPQPLSAPRMKVAAETSPPHATEAEAHASALASASASASASPAPKTSPAPVDSGFLTLSASDLLESPAEASSPLALDPPPLDLAEAPPSPLETDASSIEVAAASVEASLAALEAPAASLEAPAPPEQGGPPADKLAISAEEVGAIDEEEEISAIQDIAPVAGSTTPATDSPEIEPIANIEQFESDAAPTAATASAAEPIDVAVDVAPASIDDEATPFEISDAPLDATGVDHELSAASEPSADDIAPETIAESKANPPASDFAVSLPVAKAAAEPPPETEEAATAPVGADAGDAGTAADETPSAPSIDGADRLRPVDDREPAATSNSAIKAPRTGELSRAAQQNESAPSSEDDESLAAFMNVLPAQRLSTKSIARPPDESILSIHPLTMREELALRRERLPQEPTSPWRRSIPYAMLSLVLLAVLANLALLVVFRRDAGRDAAALQESLKKQQQLSAELILQEVRAELRAPAAENVQVLQALGDSVLAKQEALAEKLQSQLAAQHEGASKRPVVAEQDEQAKRAAEESRAAMMRELSEIKLALADMRKANVPPPPSDVAPATPQEDPVSSGEGADAAAPAAVTAASRTPIAPAVPAPAIIAGRGYQHSFVIDASGALQNAIPDAVAEVRRAMETVRAQGNVRILLLYQGRLIELPAAALQSPSRAEPVDRGEGDIAAAVKLAMEDRPSNLNLLSDTLGGVDGVADVLRKADMTGTTVNVTQFFSRSQRDQLKSLAREYHGTYGYVAPR